MSATGVADQISKDATGMNEAPDPIDGDTRSEEGGDASEKSKGKEKKLPEPVTIPLATDFERHDNWKPEPFEDGSNFNTLYTEIRAAHAEKVVEEITAICGKHVSAGLWPSGKLSVICREAEQRRAASVVAKQQCEEQQTAAAKSQAERADEKKKQLDSLKSALSQACAAPVFDPANGEIPVAERVAMGKAAAKAMLKSWAAKINAWKPTARTKAIEVCASAGINSVDAEVILQAAAAEDAASSPADAASPCAKKPAKEVAKKRKADAGASAEGEADSLISSDAEEPTTTPAKPTSKGTPKAPSKVKRTESKSSPNAITEAVGA